MEKIPANYITVEAYNFLKKIIEEKHPDLSLIDELLKCYGCVYDGDKRDKTEPCSHISVCIVRGKYMDTEPISEEELRGVLLEAGLTYDLSAMADETDEDDYNRDVNECGIDEPYFTQSKDDPRWLTIVFKLVEDTYDI